MNLNVNLATQEDFKKFFEWAADISETHVYDLLSECGFDVEDLFDNHFDENMELDEPLEPSWNIFSDEYLGIYHINIDDSFDRMGDVKHRYVVKLDNALNVNSIVDRYNKISKIRGKIATKYSKARIANDYNLAPSRDEMNEMRSIDEELSTVYGIGF